METLNTFRMFHGERMSNYPSLNHTTLFKRITDNFHYELLLKGEAVLLSPFYTVVRGEEFNELKSFLSSNEAFLDSLKEFIVNSLFVYSAAIEENSYYLFNDHDIIIARMIQHENTRFEVKFYSHYQEELQTAYNDKIYIGRIFIDLQKFEKEHFGLREYIHSILEQNAKIQERAKHKLRYFDDYKKNELDEIDYMAKELHAEALERLKLFPKGELKRASTMDLLEMLDNMLYIQNLMIELRDFTQDFENRLRLREENNYVKYVTKYCKDLINDIKYISKLYYLISMKISKYTLF